MIVAGLVAAPVALVLLAVWIVSPLFGLESCSFELDFSPRDAGVRLLPDGSIAVEPAPCGPSGIESVRVRTTDSTVVWQADADGGNDLDPATADSLVVGEAPPGFTDAVPLDRPLDPATTYTVELSVLGPSQRPSAAPSGEDRDGTSSSATATTTDIYAVLGQTARFRPSDLSPDAVWFRSELVTPTDFEREACDET